MTSKSTQKNTRKKSSLTLLPPQVQATEDTLIRPTGIPALDELMRGGTPSNATLLLAGNSGTGKTILALQWLFAGYEQLREPGIYLSLTEPISKSLQNLKTLSFCNINYIGPGGVYFTDLRGIIRGLDIENNNLNGRDVALLIETIRNMVAESGAKRVVVDSITALAYRLKEKSLIRDFIFRLGTLLAQLNVTVIMTSEVLDDGYSVFGVEEFISDGIIKLSREISASGDITGQFRIAKMRGRSYESYPVTYRISEQGVILFPHSVRSLNYLVSEKRVPAGIVGLDEMMGGGFFEGSITLLSGASGTGKTNVALHFLVAALQRGEHALYFTFEQSKDHLIKDAKNFGWDLAKYERDGKLFIFASYPGELYLEEHERKIKDIIEKHEIKRLVIDSLTALNNTYSEPEVRNFGANLMSLAKSHQVTTLLNAATTSLMGAESVSGVHLSTISDNIIMLRYVEINSELKHGILILKVRGSQHDKTLREFTFTVKGIEISSTFSGYEGVVGGSARRVSSSVEDQLHDLFMEILGPMGAQLFAEEKKKGLTQERVLTMMKELGDQGIISQNRQANFEDRIERIYGS